MHMNLIKCDEVHVKVAAKNLSPTKCISELFALVILHARAKIMLLQVE